MTKKRQMRYKISMIPETTEQDFEISRNISITVNSNDYTNIRQNRLQGVQYYQR